MEAKMKIAVTFEDEKVFQHFGHTQQFKIYEATDGKVMSSQIVSTNGSGHTALAGFLVEQGVDVLICGGIGGGAKTALYANNILLYGGVTGNADEVVDSFLAGTLVYNPDVACSHHDEEEHECSEHGCGGEHSHTCHCGHCH